MIDASIQSNNKPFGLNPIGGPRLRLMRKN